MAARNTFTVTTTAKNEDFNADGGSVLVEITGASSWDGTVDFEATIDGVTFFNIPYVNRASLTPALSVAQISSPTTATLYHLLGPLAQVRINCGAGTTGTLTVVYRVLPIGSADSMVSLVKEAVDDGLEVQGNVAHDAVAAGNPVATGGFATQDVSAETDVAAGDRVRSLATLKGAQIMAGGAELGAVAFAGYVSSISEGDTERPLAVGLYAVAPDASADRLLSLGDTAGAGLGVLAAAPWIPGASDVKTVRLTTGSTSTTRSTELTPTSGKKIRVISLDLSTDNTTVAQFEVYFGTGTNITTNAGKEIAETRLDEQAAGMLPYFTKSWPDGGGPVGAVNDVVSIRTSANIGTGGFGILTYREE